MLMKKSLVCVVVILLAFSCKTHESIVEHAYVSGEKPRNIVLLIGDGMGLSQISAAMYNTKRPMVFEEFPVIGFHKSHAADNLVTDSAAGATAFSCGVKTYVGAIGVNVDTVAQKTILEEAEERGLATGLIATSTIVHATPAAFIAHQDSREKYEDIAGDFLKVDIDLFIGGGKKYFMNREFDDRNLCEELEARNYFVNDYFHTTLFNVRPKINQNFAFFTATKHPVPAMAGRNYLPFAGEMAVDFLSQRSEEGFFLMIEGSQIDWGGHAQDSEFTIHEILDFNRTIEKVLNFAKRRGDTLVIVTADHETGGLSINKGSKFGKIIPGYTTNGHTATMVPVFAYGPSAELFAGIYENTAIYHKMKKALGFSSNVETEITSRD